MIESAEPLPEFVPLGRASAARETCHIVEMQPQRVVLDVELLGAGVVVLNDLYFPGWTASVISQGQPAEREIAIFRTNRIMRGVFLPPGQHRITYAYRPPRFVLGATISAISWLSLVAFACAIVRRRSRRGARR